MVYNDDIAIPFNQGDSMSIKISIIGAGSAVFSLNMIRDLCLTPNLQGSTVCFMDVNEERLNAAYALCSRYAQEVGIKLNLEKTTDRKKALKGANYVINSALVGGHHRLRAGWEIGKKYGYRHGGSLHFMHDEAFWVNFSQYQLFESVIQDVLEICPQAWYLQIANPVFSGITLLGRKYPQAKMIGLCHGYSGVYHLARTIGLDPDQITFEIPGVNHYVWLNRLYHKGQDAMPRLREWVQNESEAYFKKRGKDSGMGPKAVDLFRRFGVFPIGDTGTWGGGSWGWWYHTDAKTEKQWQENPTTGWNKYFVGCESQVAEIKRVAEDMSVKVSEHYKPDHSHELIISMVESLVCDIPRVMIGNILNKGMMVAGVPEDVSVEVPVLVSGRGIQGIQTHPLPPLAQAYMQRDLVVPANLELEAYEKHSKHLLLELVRMDPWTRTPEQASAALDEILDLPFLTEMKDHYQ
jgi:alpha-galactosidase